MSTFSQDLQVGVRTLVGSPLFALGAVLTLALAIGANGAVFSVASGLLINPLPWENTERVVGLVRRGPDGGTQANVSYANFLDWRQSGSFDVLAASRFWPAVVQQSGEGSMAVIGASTSPEILPKLGIGVSAGRNLVPSDGEPGAPGVIVISHALWTSRFGADPSAVGRSVELDGASHTIVGVLGEQDWFPVLGLDVLRAFRADEIEPKRGESQVQVVGLLKPGVVIEAAQSELDAIAAGAAEAFPETESGWSVVLRPANEEVFGPQAAAAVYVLIVAVAGILLIACANVGNLLLARAAARQKEFAVRSAIGASRAQIVRQLLLESSLLAIVALPAAGLFAIWTLDLIQSELPPQVSYADQLFRFDAPVWIFLAGATIATVFVFGLVPALQASRVTLSEILKDAGDRGSSGKRMGLMRSGLTILQISIALALVANSVLLVRSLDSLLSTDTGYDRENLLYTEIRLPEERYREPDQWARAQGELASRLGELPDVIRSAATSTSLAAPTGPERAIQVLGEFATPPDERETVRWTAVSPGVVPALGLDLPLGRNFDATDDAQARRVALVNEVAMRQLFEGESPIGERIALEDGQIVEIIGVVQNVGRVGINVVETPEVWVPFLQEPTREFRLLARTRTDPLALGTAVRRLVEQFDALLAVYVVTSANRQLAEALWPLRLFATLMGLLGFIAFALATVGVYGVVSYSTSQRTREFGIRSALGATPSTVAAMVLRSASWLSFVGLLLGLAFTAVIAGGLRGANLLAGSPFDPYAIVGSIVLIIGTALVASAVPAVRASRVDPMITMRS